MPENLNPPEESQRGLEVILPVSDTTNIERWAIVIGISEYQHQSLNLRYAARDAEEFYKLLLSPIGGSFKPDRIIKLIDRQATTANITKALRSFLKRPGRDDLVIFYCACHGSPDLDRPENVYLLTHDTDPNDVAGSALPMGQINQSLRETLLSKRVVLFADTCHSAAIAQESGRRNIANPNDLVNRYLQEVSISREGIALLTSAEANEVSREDAKWGGGHGVFTYYLLKGLHGEADINQNGIVTVGELFEYVRSKVQEATDFKQHPVIGTNPYDRNLPLAITALNAQSLDLSNETNNLSRETKTIVDPPKPKWQIALNKTSATVLGVAVGLIGIVGGIFIYHGNHENKITTEQNSLMPKSKFRLNIHLGKVNDRPVPSKEAIFQSLKSSGFQDIGYDYEPDLVGGAGVDYFHEKDIQSATEIAAIMNKLLPKESKQLKARKQTGKQREGTFGIWF